MGGAALRAPAPPGGEAPDDPKCTWDEQNLGLLFDCNGAESAALTSFAQVEEEARQRFVGAQHLEFLGLRRTLRPKACPPVATKESRGRKGLFSSECTSSGKLLDSSSDF